MAKKTVINNPLKTVMGPLWKLFSKESIWEILIDSFDDVYYFTKDGAVSAKPFKTEKDLNLFISRLLKSSKKKISPEEFSYFFQLDDFTRVGIVFPPVAVKGPSVVISKIPKKEITLDDLITYEALDQEGKKILESILISNKGFLVEKQHF